MAFKVHPKCVFDHEVVATQLRLGFVHVAFSDGMGRVTAVWLHLRRGTVKVDLLVKPEKRNGS